MLKLGTSLFRRYRIEHLRLARPGFALVDIDGRRMGHIDQISVQRGRLCVDGWALASSAELISEGHRARASVQIRRDDVSEALGDPELCHSGFHVSVQSSAHTALLIIRSADHLYVHRIAGFFRRHQCGAHAWVAGQFAVASLRALPFLIHYWATGCRRSLMRIKKTFGLLDAHDSDRKVLDEAVFEPPARRPHEVADRVTTIIMPVYNGYEFLPEVAARLRENTDLPYRLILIDDRSSDRKVRCFLEAWAERDEGNVTLIQNDQNLGFVGCVNRGFEQISPSSGHVVLLNSDVLVPKGWLSRLIMPLDTEEGVASVTPMSNDAEILSVPIICRRIPLNAGQVDAIDRTARRFSPRRNGCDLPTGVGFCMAIHRDVVARLPRFDAIFGRGYGEEVDWCRKVQRLGGRHLAASNLFVEHRGGASFGHSAKSELLRKNGRIITTRYPEYDADVQNFIRSDPLLTPRLALALAHAATSNERPIPIFIAHSLGGGAERYLQKRIRHGIGDGCPSVVLRVGGATEWAVEFHCADGCLAGVTSRFATVEKLLRSVEAREVIYSCAVGARQPLELLDAVRKLLSGGESSLEVLFHDYYPITPSYCLLDSDGVYRGVPGIDSNDPAHQFADRGIRIGLAQWRQNWGLMLSEADRIVVFSNDSKKHVLSAYPFLAGRIEVRPHAVHEQAPDALYRDEWCGSRIIGVLGNIGYQKGAQVVSELSSRLAHRDDLGLVVIGKIDPTYQIHPPAAVHGDYDVVDIPRLVEKYRIGAWLIPSIWPETFSYTTHEAIATGLPVFCFDLGGQAEATRRARNGHVIDVRVAATAELERTILRALEGSISASDLGDLGATGTA